MIQKRHLCPSNPQKKKYINPYQQGILKDRQLSIHYNRLYDRYQLDKIDKQKQIKQTNPILLRQKDVDIQLKQHDIEENIACEICPMENRIVEQKLAKNKQESLTKEVKQRELRKNELIKNELMKNELIKKEFKQNEVKQKELRKNEHFLIIQEQVPKKKQEQLKQDFEQKAFSRNELIQDEAKEFYSQLSQQYLEKSKSMRQLQECKISSIRSKKGITLSFPSSVNPNSHQEQINEANTYQEEIVLQSQPNVQESEKKSLKQSIKSLKQQKKEPIFNEQVFEIVKNKFQFAQNKQLSTPAIGSPISSDTVFYTCLCDQSNPNIDLGEIQETKINTTVEQNRF